MPHHGRVREALDQPGLAGLGAGVRAEWREEQEAATADAATAWRRSRSMTDWLTARMHSGDRVAVTVGPCRFTGAVREVGYDILALRADEGRVDVNLAAAVPLAFAVCDRSGTGGVRGGSAGTFGAALNGRDGDEVRVGTLAHPEGRVGRLQVARDFVIVGAGPAELVVPVVQVAWIAPIRRDG